MNTLNDTYQNLVTTWRSRNSKQTEQQLNDFDIRFAYNSGKIENPAITYYDTRDIFEHGSVRSYSGDVRTLFEIQNLKTCWKFLIESLRGNRVIDESFLLQLHKILTAGTYDQQRWQQGERPGFYKKHDYVVGPHDIGMPAVEIPSAIAELLEEIEIANPENVLTVGAYLHVKLESIHPFADGNGRVGRALLNYLLLRNDFPPVIIYDDDKISYYGAMQAWDTDEDLTPMKDFLKVETIKSWASKLPGFEK